MEIVNGVPCFNCSDVERAKKAPADGANAPNQNAFSPPPASPRNFASIAFPSSESFRGQILDRGV